MVGLVVWTLGLSITHFTTLAPKGSEGEPGCQSLSPPEQSSELVSKAVLFPLGMSMGVYVRVACACVCVCVCVCV